MQPPIAKPIGSSTPSKNNNTSITSLTSIQLPAISSQSVISSAAPIAFAAIAKHNTCKFNFFLFYFYFNLIFLFFLIFKQHM